ncbi:hypothetical protein [Cohnella sp. 56]|uniref:hypothetical protein n=1 Tax=Cohnella sp. 56 TaxID=3113722 RepID=UPI0030E7FC27
MVARFKQPLLGLDNALGSDKSGDVHTGHLLEYPAEVSASSAWPLQSAICFQNIKKGYKNASSSDLRLLFECYYGARMSETHQLKGEMPDENRCSSALLAH